MLSAADKAVSTDLQGGGRYLIDKEEEKQGRRRKALIISIGANWEEKDKSGWQTLAEGMRRGGDQRICMSQLSLVLVSSDGSEENAQPAAATCTTGPRFLKKPRDEMKNETFFPPFFTQYRRTALSPAEPSATSQSGRRGHTKKMQLHITKRALELLLLPWGGRGGSVKDYREPNGIHSATFNVIRWCEL